MSGARVKIKHRDVIDAIIQSGYDIHGRGICAGLTMKWVEAKLLGSKATQTYVDRLHFISDHHKKWQLHRKRDTSTFDEGGYAIVLDGDPDIEHVRFFKDKIEVKSIPIREAKSFNSLNAKLKKPLRKEKDGAVYSLEDDEEKNIIRTLLKEADISYSDLIDQINKARKKNKENKDKNKLREPLNEIDNKFLEVAAFFDGVVLFQKPDDLSVLFKGYDLYRVPPSQDDLSNVKNCYVYLEKNQQLYYIDAGGEKKLVVISDINKFEVDLAELQVSNIKKNNIRLSAAQFGQLITKNGGYQPVEKEVDQSDINTLEYYARSKEGESVDKTMQCIYSAPRIFDLDTLTRYIAELQTLTALENDQLVLSLGSMVHRIGLSYNTSVKKWEIMNAEGMPPFLLDGSELAKYIMDVAFEEPDITAFTFSAYTTNGFADKDKLLFQLNKCEEKFPVDDDALCHKKTKNGVSIVDIAIKRGHTERLASLKKYMDPDNKESDREKLLHNALSYGRVDCIKELLRLIPGINLNSVDSDGYTPMHCAVIHGYNDVASFLLEHHVNTNMVNRYGDTPLHTAIIHSQFSVAQLLIDNMDRGFNVQNTSHATALHLAIEKENNAVAEKLINKLNSNELNLQDTFGKTALMHAIKNRNARIAKLLIKKMNGDGLNLKDKYDDDTALSLAIKEKCNVSAKALIDTMDAKDLVKLDIDDNTLVHLAVKHDNDEIINVLIDKIVTAYPAVLTACNDKGQTALDMAILDDKEDMAEKIINKMCPSDLIDKHNGCSKALYLAIQYNCDDTVKQLLEKIGQSVLTKKNNAGNMPLHIAVKYGHLTIVKALLKLHLPEDLKIKNDAGNTPLHIAVKYGHLTIVKALLKLCSPDDLKIKNDAGNTPLDLAIQLNRVKSIQVIQQYLADNKPIIADNNETTLTEKPVYSRSGSLGVLFKPTQSTGAEPSEPPAEPQLNSSPGLVKKSD